MADKSLNLRISISTVYVYIHTCQMTLMYLHVRISSTSPLTSALFIIRTSGAAASYYGHSHILSTMHILEPDLSVSLTLDSSLVNIRLIKLPHHLPPDSPEIRNRSTYINWTTIQIGPRLGDVNDSLPCMQ